MDTHIFILVLSSIKIQWKELLKAFLQHVTSYCLPQNWSTAMTWVGSRRERGSETSISITFYHAAINSPSLAPSLPLLSENFSGWFHF